MKSVKDLITEVEGQPRPDADAELQQARLRERELLAAESDKRYNRLLKRAAFESRLIDEFRDRITEMTAGGVWKVDVARPIVRPARKHKAAEDAVLVISDSHVWKLVEPRHTLGFGHYNPAIFVQRLAHLERVAVRLLTENVANPVSRLHLLFLGDLVEGALNHGEEIPQRGLLADQILLATAAFYQFIARLSRVVPVTVRGVGGNHARWPNQAKPPTANRWSNMDFVVMGCLEQMAAASRLDRVEFKLTEGAFDVFDLGAWRFKIGHGDHLKGGDKAMGVPAHAMGREINATTQRFAAIGQPVVDYFIVGDKHRHMSLQTARGRYMVNGAWFGDDEYAMTGNFPPGRPHQLFFGVHPEIGQSWSYPLWLDNAPQGAVPYRFPDRLAEKLAEYEQMTPTTRGQRPPRE